MYSRLLLCKGGGIINADKMIAQSQDTAAILIGLGGTGVDCIRTIKTEVYNRLKPDFPDADTPKYEHIRFLGIDSDPYSQGRIASSWERSGRAVLALDDTEFFCLPRPHIMPAALKIRPEFDWFQDNDFGAAGFNGYGAGGVRQIGRLLMMDRFLEFRDTLVGEIQKARCGMARPLVNIHIFTGLGGGTGSGCFLDVCYLVRHLMKDLCSDTSSIVLGYFFLPDVNLEKAPIENLYVRDHISKNGYAALKELDYCMNLPDNGGSFRQVYSGNNTIVWNTPPVDMCHLISAKDRNHNLKPDAYEYAMNAAAEYFLSLSSNRDLMANLKAMVGIANQQKRVGSNMAYCAINALSVCFPRKEINTYLAAELFDRFSSIQLNRPSRADVERLAVSALAGNVQNIAEVYDSLCWEMRGSVCCSPHITASSYDCLEANARSMESSNENSLISRIRNELNAVLYDINRGPVYAYKMIDEREAYNLQRMIDELIRCNDALMADASLDTPDIERACIVAKEALARGGLFAKKNLHNYQSQLMRLEEHKFSMKVYSLMGNLLVSLRRQLNNIAVSYYSKLSHVITELLDTFEENKRYLKHEARWHNTSFSASFLPVDALQDYLDSELRRIYEQYNCEEGLFRRLIRHITLNENEWLSEDENRIANLVTSFCIHDIFNSLPDKPFDLFLKESLERKLGKFIPTTQFENILQDLMHRMVQTVIPLFDDNTMYWTNGVTHEMKCILFPEHSTHFLCAAQQTCKSDHLLQIQPTACTDRITAVAADIGCPLFSFFNTSDITKYERIYFTGIPSGIHIYDSNPVSGTGFCNWRQLPSPMPQSVIDTTQIPHDLALMVEDGRALFEKAKGLGLIDAEGRYFAPDPESISAVEQLADSCVDLAKKAEMPEELIHAAAVAESAKRQQVKLLPTDFALRKDGYRPSQDAADRIIKDYFVSAPATHSVVKSRVHTVETVMERLKNAISFCDEELEKKREKLRNQ